MADKYYIKPRFSKQTRLKILIPWVVTSEDMKKQGIKQYNPNYRFALIGEVLSMCCGVVLHAEKYNDGTYTVIVQYDITQCVMYEHLNSISVESGNIIKEGHLLGKCKDYLQLCYLQRSQVSQEFPVYVCGEVYYKFDPTDILYDRKSLPYSGRTDITYGDDLEYKEFKPTSNAQNDEFLNGRGDPDV